VVNRRSRRSGVAVDPADGDTVWRVDGAVTSWFASGDTMVVFNGSTMSLLSFDSGAAPATASAHPIQVARRGFAVPYHRTRMVTRVQADLSQNDARSH